MGDAVEGQDKSAGLISMEIGTFFVLLCSGMVSRQ